MSRNLSFKARARTIEHLGKGQIADCPTAVSELWKNAYDAYARDVALFTIDTDFQCGAIIDNGCGMSLEQIIDSWLIVGTESKSSKKSLSEEDRFGIEIRKTQGEKGIGRLSTAFLSPITFMVSKKIDTMFTALLIDWRLFENPYLSLDDIIVPVTSFDSLNKLDEVFDTLVKELLINIENSSNDQFKKLAWSKFSNDEIGLGKEITTQQKIIDFCKSAKFDSKLISPWKTQLEKVKALDGNYHGTALFMFQLNRDLSLMTNSGDMSRDDSELNDIEKDLIDTLRAFVNPFKGISKDFSYEIFILRKNDYKRQILSQYDVFNEDDLNALEHTVIGIIDSNGWFKGKIKAFGKDKGIVTIPPSISINNNGAGVGEFSIKLGTFEVLQVNTSLSDREHANFIEKAKKYAGLMIFRDDLRVLPYGRVDNDFFEIEERRSWNAGRYYWSKRRMFGQISITQAHNRELRDKAGREGFIKNQAARQLKTIISDLLVTLSDRYFGARSEERKELLELIKQEKDSRKEYHLAARKASQKSFHEALKKQSPVLDDALKDISQLQKKLDSTLSLNIDEILTFDEKLSIFDSLRSDVKTPIKPAKLGSLEEKYREYRDKYNEYSVHVIQLKAKLNKLTTTLNTLDPMLLAKRNLEKNQGLINAKLTKFSTVITNYIDDFKNICFDDIKTDRSIYYNDSIAILESVEHGTDLEQALNTLDNIYLKLIDSLTLKYQTKIKSLERLIEGINLDSAFSLAEEERNQIEEKMRNISSLAQLGISVEIISHELEETDSLVIRGLNSLPGSVKDHPGYKLAIESQRALTQQIRFLSPLKLSGYQSRQKITGKDIQNHIIRFFGDRFDRQRIDFSFDKEFASIAITDLPSRIYPVFINILNNALYWVCLADVRKIEIGVIGNYVLIANSGPEIDEEDIPKLFQIFYSKRANGHGVGLYLCKENLSIAHHKIWYAEEKNGDPILIKNGTNFIIEFNGLEK
ncbi:ATP-binding protein [Klebsiella pneumoniae]|uniref:sensor histidine kinase n=1 Tax=Klebsiella pneumoniae TaxID=573 RepID=UPI00195CED52|nr:sensor histidine kinase [Klebsiella pneumoniae]MBM9414045.1 ATP-binding protein [Klebsiella pneumoniae]MCP6627900.1 ATP-binding protein [Klebsiella pneumoniae]MED6004406.1 ATP-binding protein [Klebsiella pneumoniae]MED6057367.1 ATP-binding protein [Klebsiella pneumoniae]HBW3471046.1 histidine kinase [Klebsiella pneumoniae]